MLIKVSNVTFDYPEKRALNQVRAEERRCMSMIL